MIFVRKHILHHFIRKHIRLPVEFHQIDHAAFFRIKPKFLALNINIAWQNIIQNNILYKRTPVVFFIIQIFDIGKGHRQYRRHTFRVFIVPFDEHDIFQFCPLSDRAVSTAVDHNRVARIGKLLPHADPCLADFSKFAARNHDAVFINHTDCTIGRVTHLVYHALKQSV